MINSNSKSTPLRLLETFRTVFYTPIYVSVAGGFLTAEGLDVTFNTCPAQYPHPLSALKHGHADIVQSGIMRCIIALDWGAETAPLHFAESNSKDGFFVLSREQHPDFTWVLAKSNGSVPGTRCSITMFMMGICKPDTMIHQPSKTARIEIIKSRQ